MCQMFVAFSEYPNFTISNYNHIFENLTTPLDYDFQS